MATSFNDQAQAETPKKQDKTPEQIALERAKNAEFFYRLGLRKVPIDLDLLSPKGKITVAFLVSIDVSDCKVMPTITEKMDPKSTAIKDLEKIKAHLTNCGGRKRSEIDDLCAKTEAAWQKFRGNKNDNKPLAPVPPAPTAE